jgi:catechol 2,3-dioxygenase-like lactoylglutathione lyase family enzyme
MTVRWYTTVVACLDVAAQGDWWARVLGWVKAYEAADEVVLVPPHALAERAAIPLDRQGPGLVFVRVPDAKAVKNRLHIDLAPGPDDDQVAEVDRLLALGAQRADIGQGDVPWVVLRDPEGNEFCVLTPRG